jgi:hypothetical protein
MSLIFLVILQYEYKWSNKNKLTAAKTSLWKSSIKYNVV